jgi:epsilon-lactone hydrolase
MSSNRQNSLVDRFLHLGRPNIVTANTDIAELRRRYAAMFEQFGAPPAAATFEPAQIGPLKGEWMRCPHSSPNRLILYFHGGGYIAGSPKSHRSLIARLAQSAESAVFALDYRLAPEFSFPAAVRDGIDVYRQIMAKGVSASSIVFAGDGSGGGLAFAVLHAARNAKLALPSGCVAMSPWADLSLSGWSLMKNADRDALLSWELLFVSARHYLKKTNPSDPYASPAFANFRGYPPIMVHAGSAEILRDDASKLGDRAADAAIPVSVEIYDGMQHVFQASDVPEARVSLQRLGQFVRTRTAARQDAA